MSTPSDPQDPRSGDRPPPPADGPGFPQGPPQQFPSYPQQYSAAPANDPRSQGYGWSDGRFQGGRAPQPGAFPLRPLTVGEVLGAAARIARGHGATLILLCLALGLVSSALSLGITALWGPLTELVNGRWAVDFVEGRRTTIPRVVTVNVLTGLVLGLISFAITYGVAASVVARSAVGRPLDGIVAERLKGRWPALLGVAALVSVLSTLGLFLLVVPGVLLYLVWVVAMPVAVMERTGVGQSLRRSVELTRGHRGRIFGTLAAWFGIDVGVSLVLNALVQAVVAPAGTTSYFLAQLLVTLVVTALFQAWLAAIVAVTYVDLRMRKENLGPALAAAAQQRPSAEPTS